MQLNECERLIGTLLNHMLHDLCKLSECERLIDTFLNYMLQQMLLNLYRLEGNKV